MQDHQPHELAPPPSEQPIKTPDWVKHAVFYQIFPDRFARSSRIEHLPGLKFQEWGAPPLIDSFQGGDLLGIVDKLPYLEDLGVTALYLTPIFQSASNHRYHTYDYFKVDPLLGGDDALRELLDKAHERDIRVVLDGVFNHTGRGFWAFHHILENGGNSPYIDWFKVRDWPLHPYPTGKKQKTNYDAWWGLPALPKLNTDHPAVREHLYEVARHWIRFGIDGWRLDVPSEIDDDDFWRTFRQVVKSENPDAYICGEIWHEAKRWLAGDQFDAVMNYLFTSPALSFFAAETIRDEFSHPELTFKSIDAKKFGKMVDKMLGHYDWEINFAQMNMLDSHDMPRALWITRDESALRLCVLLQMTMPGAPCIYYGDEVGVTGGVDPDCRRAFPWHDESQWNYDLLRFYQRAIALRKTHPVLRVGSFESLHAKDLVYAFRRELDGSEAVVAFNAGKKPAQVTLPVEQVRAEKLRQVWPLESHCERSVTDDGMVCEVPARDVLVLIRES